MSGLDLDPEERELLVRVVGNASIALSAIELARYRAAARRSGSAPQRPNAQDSAARRTLAADAPASLVAVEADPPERVRERHERRPISGVSSPIPGAKPSPFSALCRKNVAGK